MIQTSTPGGFLPYSGIQTQFIAAHNSSFVNIDRFDHFFISTQINSGYTQINIDISYGLVNPLPAYGDTLLYVGGSETGIYSVLSSSTTTIVIDKPFTASDTGYVNLNTTRKGWHIRCDAYVYNGATYDLIGQSKHHPSAAGRVEIDICSYMRNQLNMIDSAYYAISTSFVDPNICKLFRFEFFEVFIGNTPVIDAQYSCTGVNAAMKTGHKIYANGGFVLLGENMSEFFPEPSGQDLVLFLSSVRKLRYWAGLPFDIGYFYSVNLTTIATTFKRFEVYYDASGNIITAASFDLPFGGIGSGYHNKIHRSGLAPTEFLATPYPSNYKSLRIYLSADGVAISEVLEIRIEQCFKNPVMLKAFDTVSGWRYFCFTAKQARGLNIQSNGTFKKWFQNLATQNSDVEFISKSIVPELKIGADQIDIYDSQIIEVILGSAKVYMLTNPYTWLTNQGTIPDPAYEGAQWEVVRVRQGTYTTSQTNKTLYSAEFSIELLEINTPTQ